jgi:hypothetical protein
MGIFERIRGDELNLVHRGDDDELRAGVADGNGAVARRAKAGWLSQPTGDAGQVDPQLTCLGAPP